MRRVGLSAAELFSAAALFLCVALSAGCAKAGNASLPENATAFTDALGRCVTVAEKPERVAALTGSLAEVWLLSGGSLCAAPKEAWEDFNLNLENAANIGGAHSPGVEALLAAEPELVLAGASAAADTELREILENAGINVAFFEIDCFDDYLWSLKICTDITGRKDLYTENGVSVGTKISEIKAEFAKAALPAEKRTILLLRLTSGTVKAKGSEGTVLGEMLKELGCINIADSDSTLLDSLSAEAIIRLEPYHIFAVAMGSDTEKATAGLYKMLEENPAFGSLAAIKENRLHIMDKKLFHNKPNARWAEAYEILNEILLEKNK